MTMTSRAQLEVRGVSLDLVNERTRHSLPVLRDIDLHVFAGELVSIVGPSGSASRPSSTRSTGSSR